MDGTTSAKTLAFSMQNKVCFELCAVNTTLVQAFCRILLALLASFWDGISS